MLRVVAMFAAAFSMTVNPSAGYFPPAGGQLRRSYGTVLLGV